MAVDLDAVRDGLNGMVPFNGHLGLEVLEVAPGRGVVRLPDDQRLYNHVGSQHAGALFAVGEAASGAAFAGAFAEELGSLRPLAKSASIDYRKVARGAITATATLAEDGAALLERMDADGRVEFPVAVELTDAEGNAVAALTVHWHVRRNA